MRDNIGNKQGKLEQVSDDSKPTMLDATIELCKIVII